MLIIKVLTRDFEDWGEDVDDFYVCFQVGIGCKDILGSGDMFTFEVVSPKRLGRIIQDSNIEIGRGYLIMNDFNIKHIESTVNHIISKCQNADYDLAMKELSKYFRWEMDT